MIVVVTISLKDSNRNMSVEMMKEPLPDIKVELLLTTTAQQYYAFSHPRNGESPPSLASVASWSDAGIVYPMLER